MRCEVCVGRMRDKDFYFSVMFTGIFNKKTVLQLFFIAGLYEERMHVSLSLAGHVLELVVVVEESKSRGSAKCGDRQACFFLDGM